MKKIIFSLFLITLAWSDDESDIPQVRSELNVPFYYTINGGPDISFAEEMLGPFRAFLGTQYFNKPKVSDTLTIYAATLKEKNGTEISRGLTPMMCLEKADICALIKATPTLDEPKTITFLEELLIPLKDNYSLEDLKQGYLTLENLLGSIKAAFIISHLHILSVSELIQVAGYKSHEEFLVLRRFGYIRNRMQGMNQVEEMHTDLILFDSTHPYVPGWMPPPAFSEQDSQLTFEYNNYPRTTQELRFMWGQFSDRFHKLALTHYENERIKGQRQIFTEHLLQQLRQDNQSIDLERAFFFTVENYSTEQLHATLALIDGDTRARANTTSGLYEVPVVRNILNKSPSFNLRKKFGGRHVFEVHSLAKDPKKLKEIPLESLALLIAEHLDINNFSSSVLLVQTDAVGARRFKKFGFSIDKEASAILGGEMRVLTVLASNFIRETRKLYPVKGHINIALPNPLSKRFSRPAIDSACLLKLRGEL
ncbi:MAG: hypothetical protein R3A80_13680 [Bdellovibrionota bacterium]